MKTCVNSYLIERHLREQEQREEHERWVEENGEFMGEDEPPHFEEMRLQRIEERKK